MESNETGKTKGSPVVFFILTFIASIFFEFYLMTNFPYEYLLLFGTGLIVLITGYLSIDTLLRNIKEAEEIRKEQNELMIKAQKAIYLATKKSSSEAEDTQIKTLQSVDLMVNKLIENINFKQLEDNSGKSNDISGLIDQLTSSNDKLAKEVQNAITVNELVKANADLVQNVKQVLNGNYTAPVISNHIPEPEAEMPDIIKEFHEETPDIAVEKAPDPAVEKAPIGLSQEDLPEIPDFDGLPDQDDFIEPEVPESAQAEIEDDVNSAHEMIKEASDEIMAIEAANELEEDPSSIEEAYNELSTQSIDDNKPVAEDKPVFNEPADPNATLSEEEIAALFANL